MSNHEDRERDLTTDDVARLLRLNRVTVQRMLASGRLKGYRLGRSWRVPRAVVEEFRLVARERMAMPYGPTPTNPRVITDRQEWLRAFRGLSGSIAVRPPRAASLHREALYGDRS